jgi:hypothetical protein
LRDLPRQRRLSYLQAFRRPTKVELFGDRDKIFEALEFHPIP